MSGYVLVRSGDGAYVAPPGRAASYTKSLQHARIFDTKEQAERERCPENESIVPVEAALRRG